VQWEWGRGNAIVSAYCKVARTPLKYEPERPTSRKPAQNRQQEKGEEQAVKFVSLHNRRISRLKRSRNPTMEAESGKQGEKARGSQEPRAWPCPPVDQRKKSRARPKVRKVVEFGET